MATTIFLFCFSYLIVNLTVQGVADLFGYHLRASITPLGEWVLAPYQTIHVKDNYEKASDRQKKTWRGPVTPVEINVFKVLCLTITWTAKNKKS